MQDARNLLKLDIVEIFIDRRRLQVMGHQMRLPEERVDLPMLWLRPEGEFVSTKSFGGKRLRVRSVPWQKS